MLDVSKLIVETMKRRFPNKDATLNVLRELKIKQNDWKKTNSDSKFTNKIQTKILDEMKLERTNKLSIVESKEVINVENEIKVIDNLTGLVSVKFK